MMVEMDHGIAAFASINAQQGYRPSPIVEYALKLLGASRDGKTLPPLPAANPPTRVENAAHYTGSFKSGARSLEFIAEGDKLFLVHEGARLPLEKSHEPDRFVVMHRDFDRYLLLFGRKDSKDAKSPVVEVAWGPDWYTNAATRGRRNFSTRRSGCPSWATIATRVHGRAASASSCAKGNCLRMASFRSSPPPVTCSIFATSRIVRSGSASARSSTAVACASRFPAAMPGAWPRHSPSCRSEGN